MRGRGGCGGRRGDLDCSFRQHWRKRHEDADFNTSQVDRLTQRIQSIQAKLDGGVEEKQKRCLSWKLEKLQLKLQNMTIVPPTGADPHHQDHVPGPTGTEQDPSMNVEGEKVPVPDGEHQGFHHPGFHPGFPGFHNTGHPFHHHPHHFHGGEFGPSRGCVRGGRYDHAGANFSPSKQDLFKKKQEKNALIENLHDALKNGDEEAVQRLKSSIAVKKQEIRELRGGEELGPEVRAKIAEHKARLQQAFKEGDHETVKECKKAIRELRGKNCF